MTNYNDKFLHLLEHNLDNFQDKALKTTKNAVIAAGAGSGKTQVLATRFAWLILTKQAKPEEILTLTFTNKAAAEMYQRIYQTLTMFAELPVSENLTAEQKQLAKNALENFSKVHIQTLDSYCSYLLRQCANRYGIKPDFTTGSADSERQVKDQAFIFILQNDKNLAVQTYAKAGELQNFAENVFASIILQCTSLATTDGFFARSLEKQVLGIVNAWNNLIIGKEADSINSYINVIQDAFNASDKIDSKEKHEYKKELLILFELAGNLFDSEPLTKDDVVNYSAKFEEEWEKYQTFITQVFKVQGAKGKTTDISTKITPLKDKINGFFNSIPAFIKEYPSLKALNELLDQFLHQINNIKRTSGNLTFTDVSEMSLKVLLENEDIRNQEKNAYSKIMIDEFQDNNGKNRDLLYLLSLKPGVFENEGKCKISVCPENPLHNQIIIKDDEGKIIEDKRSPDKLFFVGDEKQSIYKFRGAEVSVFNELTQNGENELIPMVNNYRSTKELVQSFNVLFKNGNGIFQSHNDGPNDLIYEAYYDNDAQKKDTILPELTKENIPIHAVCLKENDIKDETGNFIPKVDQLAYDMAERIYNMANEKKNWNDFAILAKGRTHYQEITKYLNLFGIPFNIDQQKNIFSDGIINDFYNFLKICVYPSDTNALASYFTSPLAGISEKGVEIIISYMNESDDGYNYTLTLSDKYDCQLKKDLTPLDFERFCKARTLFFELKKQVLCQPITKTLSYLWHNKGYKYEAYLTEQIELNAEHFDMLFELARQADESGKSVSWFIDQLDKLKSQWTQDNADLDAAGITYPIEKPASVNIMTIHKSKGLEFKHVFLFGCTDVSKKTSSAVWFYDEEYGVSIKPENGDGNFFAIKNKEIANKKELAEFRRLIYVGVTRAVQDLYIMCSYSIPKKDSSNQDSFKLFETIIKNRYGAVQDEEYPFYADLGFDYIKITPVTYNNIVHQKKADSDEIRKIIIETKAGFYSQAGKINFEQHAIPRATPSSLEKNNRYSEEQKLAGQNTDFLQTDVFDSDSGQKYENASDVLDSAQFSAADFGTLVHKYLEMQALGIEAEQIQPEPKLLKNLTQAEAENKMRECIKMCKNFDTSLQGQELKKAKQQNLFYRAEWAFRMFLNGTIFTGSIDLIYQTAKDSYTIVDYKSDTKICPEIYTEQQHAYRTAAAKLLGVDEKCIKLVLYYLRENVAVNVE